MNELLPIGSVVLLKDSNKRVMIIGRLQRQANNDQIWDYAGCLFPEGMLSPEQNYLFNKEQIVAVYFIGCQDREELEFKNVLLEKYDELKGKQSSQK